MKTNKNDYTKPNFKGRRFVMGDVHGGFIAMKQALEKANFDYNNDVLFCLGDVLDGWSQSKEVIDELLKIKNLIYLLGNHDEWSMEYYNGETMRGNEAYQIPMWFTQGGESTIKSLGTYENQNSKYLEFLKSGLLYYSLQDENEELPIIFAHAGIPNKLYHMDKLVENNNTELFIWDRNLISEAARHRNDRKWVDNRYKEIYLGHSGVGYLMSEKEHQFKPQKITNVFAMDTNAAYDGKVSIMDIDTKEIYQSQFVYMLYPDERGRNSESLNEYIKRQS